MSRSLESSTISKRPDGFEQKDWSSAYRNVEKELSQIPLSPKRGQIPQEICGTLFRNGPGRLERSGQWVHHPFDGDGMVTAVRLINGTATLTNRFIRTKEWKEEEKADRFLYRGVFGTQKPGGQLANMFDLRLKNIANTNVIQLGDQVLALWEAASPHALNPVTLETYGLSSLEGVLKPQEAFSAHPRFDPGHKGSPMMVNFGVKTGPKSTIRLMEFATTGPSVGRLINERKDVFDGFAFLHDFAITPNWAIFLQNAISFNPLPFVLGNKGAAQCLSSELNKNGKFLIIPRESGTFAGQPPLIYDAPKGFVFHHLNAWEKGEEIVLDSIYYKDFPSIDPGQDFRSIDFGLLPEGLLSRCRINISTKEVASSVLSNQCCEFAMVNPTKQGLEARFSWMATAQQKTGNAPLQAIKKLDLLNGENYTWSAAPRGFVSEPVMIPKPDSDVEDEGWVIVLVWNGARIGTDLVILKANDLSEEALIELPISIPHGLHGSWAQCK